MSFSISSSVLRAEISVPPPLPQQILSSYDTLAQYFDHIMTMIPKEPVNALQASRILSQLKPLDRSFIRFFHQQRSTRSLRFSHHLDSSVSQVAQTKSTLIDALDIELPILPFFSHPHPFNNLKEHQHLYTYGVSQGSKKQLRLIENLAESFFKNSEFLTVPLTAITKVATAYPVHALSLQFQFPSQIYHCILHNTLKLPAASKKTLLGSGSYAHVYARCENNSTVAMKVFKNNAMLHKIFSDTFFLEVGMHMLVPKHPSIVKMYAADADAIYFPYGKGLVFSELLKNQLLTEEQIVEYFFSIAQALDHLHSRGLVYMDLKPNNIIIEPSKPHAKLIDLGFLTLEKEPHDPKFCPTITPPEFILKRKHLLVSSKSDVWAYGVMLYQTLTKGHLPFFHHLFRDRNLPQAVAEFVQEFPCSQDRLISQLSPTRQDLLRTKDPSGRLLDIVTACLHGDPLKRPSMKDITMRLAYKIPETTV